MEKKNNIAVYPGSFDPITKGHTDIIKRASKIFDKVYVAVLHNSAKNPMFTIPERIELIKRITSEYDNVYIDTFSGLLVDYMEKIGANVIIKGLRAISDFEYEFQMALMNHKLNRNIETMFLMTSAKYSYLSSSIVKEVAKYNGSLEGLVDERIMDDIITRAYKA